MNELLSHPAVQAGAAPFAAGLVAVLALYRFRLGGLAVGIAFAITLYLVTGFDIAPVSATRKIALLTLLAPLIGLAVDFTARGSLKVASVLAALSAIASVWVFWPVLAQKSGLDAAIYGVGIALFVAWVVALTNGLAVYPLRAAAATLALGMAAAVCAVLGGSALFGQYAGALAAGAGAFALWLFLSSTAWTAGFALTFPAALGSALLLSGTVLLAQLTWPALIVAAFIQLSARLPVPRRSSPRAQLFMLSIYTLCTVAATVWIIFWRPPIQQ